MNAQNHRLRLGALGKRHSGSKHAVLHSQINRRNLGPIETSNSDAKVSVLNAQNHRCRLGAIGKRHSGSKHAVLHSQINRRRLGPIETCNSGAKVVVLNAKNIGDVWDP